MRRNLLVPVPRAASLAALNEQLLEGCRRRLGDRLRGHDETIGERLVRDLAAFHDLPPTPYDACEKKAGRVSSLSLVRYRGTDYSVPTAYGHREVMIRGYVDAVVISCGAEVIARHPRSYERADFVFNPLHYLALLEHKIGALDQAAPLVGWDLPAEFATLRRLLEARMAKRGKREFVQILRLLEVFRPEDVLAGIREAIARGAIGFDAVKHFGEYPNGKHGHAVKRQHGFFAGNARIAVLPAATGAELGAFLKTNLAAGSHLLTDGFAGYRGRDADLGEHLKHTPVVQDAPANAGEFFPITHILFSNIKAWLVGTHHGVSAKHLREWSYRFNRRTLTDRLDGYLIRRAVECATITYDQLTAGAMPGGANRTRRLPVRGRYRVPCPA